MAELGWPLLFEDRKTNWYQAQLTFAGGLITDVTRAAGVEGDGLPVGSGVGVWPAATNLEANGGAESNVTGHTAGGSNPTPVRTSFQSAGIDKMFGDYFFKCVYADNAVLDSVAITLTAAAHSAQRRIYIPSDYDGTQVSVQFSGFTSATGTLSVNADMSKRDQWQHVQVPNVTPNSGDLTGAIIVSESGSPTTGWVGVDGCQTEVGTICTPYIETDGGTASRTAGRIQIPDAHQLLTETQGGLIACIGWDWNQALEPGGGSGFSRVLGWQSSVSVLLYSQYIESSNVIAVGRANGGSSSLFASKAITPAKGSDSLVAMKWQAGSGGIAVDGSSFSIDSTADDVPDLSALTSIDLGSNAGSANFLYSRIKWAIFVSGVLTDAHSATLAASFGSSPPTPGQVVSVLATAKPTALLPMRDATFYKFPANLVS